MDTYGSRSLVVGGEAVVKAADKVIEQAKPIAAHLLEADVDDLEFSAGRFSVKGTDQGMGIAEVALATFAAHNYPEGIEPNIDAEATFDPVNFSFPHGTHLCAMEVDTETGAVTMRKYVCVDDIGNIINPLIVGGQVHGGLVQGIAQALLEEAVYDDSGTLVSGSFVDYLLPTSADTISFEIDHTTSPSTYQHARHQGRRRGRARSPRPRPWSTPSSTRSGSSASTTSPMPCTPGAGLEGDPHLVRRRAAPPRVRRCRTSTSPNPASPARKEQAHDSRPVRLPGADQRRGGAQRAGVEHGDDVKIMAGGQSLLPVLRMRLNAPDVVIDLGRIDSLRGVRDDGDAHRHRRADHALRDRDQRPGQGARPAAVQGGGRGGGQPDPAPRHLRRARAPTPTRPATWGRRRWRSTPSS